MRSDLENRITVSSTVRAPSAEALQNAPDLASPCASNENSCFRESIIINKSESPKLSLEPLQMKRKKKGGGCNLRKSLAWDRAFFTEEGILDPLELSSISEVSCREDEYVGKDRKKDWSSSKLDSSSSNLTSHKFQTRLGSKPGSRCGDCPQPLPSPSLKRPANINVGKAAGKELKLPKVHGLKPGSSPTCATTRSSILRASRFKNYQIMQPDFSIQRHAEPKSCSKSLKNTQNASRANTLQSAHHSDGNSGNSSLRRYSSISMSTAMVDTVDNSASKMFSDNATPTGLEMSSVGQRYDSTGFEAPISQNAHNSGKDIHPSQSIMARPTGLRMPSPSLSFFSQPKPSVYWDLPQRNTETGVFGSQKPRNVRLQDNLKMAKLSSRIPESTISSSKAVSSKTECMASSHVTAFELVQPNSEQNPVLKVRGKMHHDVLNSHPNKISEGNYNVFDGLIQDLPQKNVLARISHEAEMQKIGSEVPSQIESCEPALDKRLKKAVDGCPVKSESHELKWRNTEFGSKLNCIIEESETIYAIDEPPKEKDTCNYFVLDHGSTQFTDALNDGVQNTLTTQSCLRKTCKPDCHEPQKENTTPPNFFLGESDVSMDKDKNVLVKKERTSERLGVPQQNGSCCSGSIKALKQRQIKTENTYFVSKHQCADLLNKSASLEVLTDTLPSGEAHMQNYVFASTTEGCENDIISMLEAGDDIIQPCKSAEVQDICCKVEMKLQRTLKLNSSDRLSLEKQISCQISQQGENIERLPFVLSDGKHGNKVIGSKMPISLSPGRWHDSNLGEDKIVSPPTGIKFDSANNLLSSECVTSTIIKNFQCNDRHQGSANMLLNGTAHENLSHYIHQDTQRTDIVNCSPLPVSRINQLSQKDTLEKATEEVSCIQEVSADSRLISTMSLKDCASDIDNLRCLQDTGAVLVQSPERNMLNDCCPKQSECMALPSDGFVAENCVHSNDRLQTKSPADVYSEDDALGSMEDSVTGQTRSSPAKESSSIHEIGNDSYETGDHIADAITNPLIVKPSSETIKDEGTNSSPSCLQPKLDHVKVEAASAPKNTHQNGLNEKSRSIILPQNAVPFSDEWLAAIEAAGEDILTKKTGAVQNSPPDKSLPEPSPWSPVKRKNNQIGPFDCTKFTAPSGST